MAALVAYTDFTGLIAIDTGRSDVQAEVALYITAYERLMLTKFWGEDGYQDYIANRNQLVPTNKYTKFEVGETYTEDGILKKWDGVKEFLKNFIYFYYVQDQLSANSPQGETTGLAINQATARQKLTRAWNDGVYYWNKAIDYVNYKNGVDSTTFPYFEPEELFEMNSFGI